MQQQSNTPEVVISRAGDGDVVRTSDDRPMTLRIRSEATNGVLKLVQMEEAPRAQIPLHEHDYPEAWLVLEGSYLVHANNVWHQVGTGDFVYLPPRLRHGIAALEGAPARKLSFVLESAATADPATNAAPTNEMRSVQMIDVPGSVSRRGESS